LHVDFKIVVEGKMQPMDDVAFGAMLGGIQAIHDANARAADWEHYAHEVESNRDLWMTHAKKIEAENAALKAKIAELEDKLAVEQAHSEGLSAVVNAFKFEHPDSPLLQEAGQFRSGEVAGRPKRKYHLVYESAFDAEARKNGISNPASRRFN
jgi:hypothetical protein